MLSPTSHGEIVAELNAQHALESAKVTGNFFSLLRVQPACGRPFNEDDDSLNGPNVVILSDSVWQERFNADPNVIGQSITLTEESYSVIGVMPADFEFPRGVDLWLPLATTANARTMQSRGMSFMKGVARLKAGVTIAEAEAEVNTIISRLAIQAASRPARS